MSTYTKSSVPLLLVSKVWKLSFVFGIILSVGAGWSIRTLLKRNHDAAELVRFEKVVENISNELERFDYGLQGTAGASYIKDHHLSWQSFRGYAGVRNFFENFKGSLGFGFIRLVKNSDKARYIKEQKLLNPLFKDHALEDPSVPRIDASFSIELIEPIEHNQQALGLDIATEKNRQEAAIRSMKSGRPALTKKILLVQANGKGPGFLYMLPIYQGIQIPQDEAEREKKLIGWAYTPIVASNLVENALSLVSTPPQIRIYEDEVRENNLLYSSTSQSENTLFQADWSKIIQMGGQKWIIQGSHHGVSFWNSYNIVGLMTVVIASLCTVIVATHIRRVKWEIEMRNEAIALARKEVSQSREALSEQKTFLQTVIDSLPALIGYWNKNLTNVFSNRYYLEFFGNDLNAIQGHHMKEILGRKVYEANLPFIEKVLQGEPQVFEREIKDVHGNIKFFLANYIPDVRNREVFGFFVIAMDITKLKQLENERREYQANLAAASKMSSLGEMAGGIAHEINNPLTIIQGNVRSLKKKFKAGTFTYEEMLQWETQLSKIDSTVNRIAKIIQGLRSFSRNADSDPMESISISQIVKETLELCTERFRNHSVELRVNCTVDTLIECRPTQISQIIMNLLNNGYDVVENLNEKWVQLDVSSNKDSVILSVTDSGMGISPEISDKIMQPFYTTKEVGKGTGLGLSISKRIAEEHHGEFTYDSSALHTRFVLKLPLKQPSSKESKHSQAA